MRLFDELAIIFFLRLYTEKDFAETINVEIIENLCWFPVAGGHAYIFCLWLKNTCTWIIGWAVEVGDLPVY